MIIIVENNCIFKGLKVNNYTISERTDVHMVNFTVEII